MQEGVLNQVAQLVETVVVRPLIFPVFLWRNDRVHVLKRGLGENGGCIVPLVRDQMIGAQALDQTGCLRAIRSGTLCNNDSDRHTKRIHGQMYLGVKPPFVRLISWFPPLAPAA